MVGMLRTRISPATTQSQMKCKFISTCLVADEVQVYLYVLRALMLHGIGGKVDGADVVAVDKGDALKRVVELVE